MYIYQKFHDPCINVGCFCLRPCSTRPHVITQTLAPAKSYCQCWSPHGSKLPHPRALVFPCGDYFSHNWFFQPKLPMLLHTTLTPCYILSPPCVHVASKLHTCMAPFGSYELNFFKLEIQWLSVSEMFIGLKRNNVSVCIHQYLWLHYTL